MTLFAALSADQMATVEDAAADPFPLELSRAIDLYASRMGARYEAVSILFAGAVITMDRARDAAEHTITALRNLGPILDDVRIRLDVKPVANPRAPIPAALRRRNRDRWQ